MKGSKDFSTYVFKEFLNHPIPLIVLSFGSINAILLQVEGVIEAKHQRQFMNQINAKTFESCVAGQFKSGFRQHSVRRTLVMGQKGGDE